jgi:hypothetical protein
MELIKSCDAEESNNIIIGRPLRKKVPISTSSLVGISSMVVLLARLDCGAGPLCHPFCWFTIAARAHGELSCFTRLQSRARWPIFPQWWHKKPVGVNSCGGLATACCGYREGEWLYCCYCYCGWNYAQLPQYCCWGWCSCPEGGVYTIQYFEGPPLDPPFLQDPGMILFLFFSSVSAHAFIVLSWSMVALAKSL